MKYILLSHLDIFLYIMQGYSWKGNNHFFEKYVRFWKYEGALFFRFEDIIKIRFIRIILYLLFL